MKRDSEKRLDWKIGRISHDQLHRTAWLQYLFTRLPENEQDDAVLAFADMMMPADYERERS